MGRYTKERRTSTIKRHNEVHKAYDELKAELGKWFYSVRRDDIYLYIQEKTGLCTKCIAYILNHTKAMA